MAEDQGSEAWLDRQKQKLNAMHDSRYQDDWKDRQNRQLVEELKSRQSSWKEEKTEKTTESVESSPSELPTAGNNRTSLHPIQIGTLGDDYRGEPRSCSAKYYYETKHKEIDEGPLPSRNGHVTARPRPDVNYSKKESYFDEKRTTTDAGPRYRALNSLPLRSEHITERSVPVYREHGRGDKTYLEDSRSVNSYSQGYNTLTSEDEYGYEDRTLKSRTGGTLETGRNEVAHYTGPGEHTLANGGGRVRSQSFGTSGGPRASDIFREAVRHVGPDGEIVYTSRRYDTKKTTTDEQGLRAPRPVGPVALPARQYLPLAYEPARVDSYVDDDGAVVVTETYKRVREVRTDGASGPSAPPLASPLRERMMIDSRPAALTGGDQEEYMYRRKLYESQTVPAPTTQTFSRSRSAHDFQNGADYYRDSEARRPGDGGRTYYYHKTSSYDDVDPPAPPKTNGYCAERYYRRGETETDMGAGSQDYVRQQPLQSQRYAESRRYDSGKGRRENQEYRSNNGYSRTGYEHRFNTATGGGGSPSSSYYDTHNSKRPPQLSHPPTRREIEELNTFLKDFGDVK